jgi:hypothetical protein
VTPRVAAFAVAAAIVTAACAHAPDPPAGYRWGIPIYPRAAAAGSETSKASFVIYKTDDPVDAVDAWYAAELPRGTQHAYDAERRQATFALFDRDGRRTVHIEREGASTIIEITRLAM